MHLGGGGGVDVNRHAGGRSRLGTDIACSIQRISDRSLLGLNRRLAKSAGRTAVGSKSGRRGGSRSDGLHTRVG